jgi:hypothetical protein
VLSLQHCFLVPGEVAGLVFELSLLDIHEIMQCEQSSEPQSDGYRKLLNDAQKSTYWSLTMMRCLVAISSHSCMGPIEGWAPARYHVERLPQPHASILGAAYISVPLFTVSLKHSNKSISSSARSLAGLLLQLVNLL